jgi:hypothetical protein
MSMKMVEANMASSTIAVLLDAEILRNLRPASENEGA